MTKKRNIIIGFIFLVLLTVAIVCFFRFCDVSKLKGKQHNHHADDVKPIPTIPIPENLKNLLTAAVLNVLNTYLSESITMSLGNDRRKTSLAAIKLKQLVAAGVERELKNLHGRSFADIQNAVRDDIRAANDEAKNMFISVTGNTKNAEFYEPIEPEAIVFAEVPGRNDLLAVTTTVSVNCGGDMSLYLYKKAGSGYKLLLKYENTDPESNGNEGLHFALSKPANPDDLFVVIYHGTPWCTSCWGNINYSAIKPGADAGHPVVLFEKKESFYRCGETELKTGESDFLLSYSALTSTNLRHYNLEQGKMVRTGPLAFSPKGFISEWIHIPWNDAKQFCPANKHKTLKKWHEKLKKYSYDLKFVQLCMNRPDQWEIGLLTEGSGLTFETYLEVSKENGDFILNDIRTTRLPECPGEATPEGRISED